MKELERLAISKGSRSTSASYTGSDIKTYSVSTPRLRAMLKDWLGGNTDREPADLLALADLLMTGQSHDERKLAAYLLGYRNNVRALVDVDHLDRWLAKLSGWAEIDALCQNTFGADEVIGKWDSWKPFLQALSVDENINKRRASLVFLVGPTRKSDDTRLHTMAAANINALKSEKSILITKAISWLLRCMMMTRREETAAFLDSYSDSLPKIAVRETRAKLKLGKKR